jgi:hypothetical protein
MFLLIHSFEKWRERFIAWVPAVQIIERDGDVTRDGVKGCVIARRPRHVVDVVAQGTALLRRIFRNIFSAENDEFSTIS